MPCNDRTLSNTCVGARDALRLILSIAVGNSQRVAYFDAVPIHHWQCHAVADALAVRDADLILYCDSLSVAVANGDSDPIAVADGQRDPLSNAVSDAFAVPDGQRNSLAYAVPNRQRLSDAFADKELDTNAVPVGQRDSDAISDTDGQPNFYIDALPDGLRDPLSDPVCYSFSDRDA